MADVWKAGSSPARPFPLPLSSELMHHIPTSLWVICEIPLVRLADVEGLWIEGLWISSAGLADGRGLCEVKGHGHAELLQMVLDRGRSLTRPLFRVDVSDCRANVNRALIGGSSMMRCVGGSGVRQTECGVTPIMSSKDQGWTLPLPSGKGAAWDARPGRAVGPHDDIRSPWFHDLPCSASGLSLTPRRLAITALTGLGRHQARGFCPLGAIKRQ